MQSVQLVTAIGRNFWSAPAFEHLDAWVVSPGGVGTTFLLNHINQYIQANNPDDLDGLKHWPKPPLSRITATDTRILFVMGDIPSIVSSIDRRGWLSEQSAKLGHIFGVMLRKESQRRAFAFAVLKMQRRWTEEPHSSIMTVKYDDIWDQAAMIAEHLEIVDKSFIEEFPERKPRHP